MDQEDASFNKSSIKPLGNTTTYDTSSLLLKQMKSLWDVCRPWKRSLKSQSRILIPTPLPHNKIHLVNIVHHVEEVEVGIVSTKECYFVVALEGHAIGMHISRMVAQIIEAVVTRVVIVLCRWAHGGRRKKG